MSGLVVRENEIVQGHFGNRRATLMQRVDRKDLFGVHMLGAKFTCPLPEGYDALTEVYYAGGRVFVTRPGQKTLVCDFNTGTTRSIV